MALSSWDKTQEADMQVQQEYQLLSVRVNSNNPNHHLWNNNGTWFIHYTVYPDAYTARRIRRSLRTKSLTTARKRRDAFIRLTLNTQTNV